MSSSFLKPFFSPYNLSWEYLLYYNAHLSSFISFSPVNIHHFNMEEKSHVLITRIWPGVRDDLLQEQSLHSTDATSCSRCSRWPSQTERLFHWYLQQASCAAALTERWCSLWPSYSIEQGPQEAISWLDGQDTPQPKGLIILSPWACM